MSAGQTDRQTSGKTTRWQITVYEGQWPLMETMPPGITWWGWQKEICPRTQRPHYQGAMISQKQHRWSGCKGDYKVGSSLTQQLPGVHIEPADNWPKLLQYCKKEDTRAPGSQFVAQTNSIPTHFQYAEHVAKYIATAIPNGRSIHELTNDRLQQLIDDIVKQDIASGKRYAAWIASNPQWKAMWKPYGRVFIISFIGINAPTCEEGSPQAEGREGKGSQDSHSQVSS